MSLPGNGLLDPVVWSSTARNSASEAEIDGRLTRTFGTTVAPSVPQSIGLLRPRANQRVLVTCLPIRDEAKWRRVFLDLHRSSFSRWGSADSPTGSEQGKCRSLCTLTRQSLPIRAPIEFDRRNRINRFTANCMRGICVKGRVMSSVAANFLLSSSISPPSQPEVERLVGYTLTPDRQNMRPRSITLREGQKPMAEQIPFCFRAQVTSERLPPAVLVVRGLGTTIVEILH